MNTQQGNRKSKKFGIMIALAISLVVGGGVFLFSGPRPIEIKVSSKAFPPFLPFGGDGPSIDQIGIDYRIVGKLPGELNEVYLLMVEREGDPPYARQLSGSEVAAGGSIGLAVPKKGIKCRIQVKRIWKGKPGETLSNVLDVDS